jgi:precorrin-3B C17-methyltransferase
MLAVSARVGALLGHDFARSLSDNLKPWDLILRRLAAAADAGFVIAIYNPISRARLATRRRLRGAPAPAPRVDAGRVRRAVGRADEKVAITTLAAADPNAADMATLIIVGSSETRLIARPGRSPLVYTPRAVESVRV